MLNIFSNLSIKYKIVFTMTFLILMISIFIILYFPSNQNTIAEKTFTNESITLSEMTASRTSEGLEYDDKQFVTDVIDGAKKNKYLAYVLVKKKDGKIFYEFNKDKFKSIKVEPDIKSSQHVLGDDFLTTFTPIKIKDKVIGILITGFTLQELKNNKAKSILTTLIICIIILIISVLFSFYMSSKILKPLVKITEVAQKIADGDLKQDSLEVSSKDEIGILANVFNNSSFANST